MAYIHTGLVIKRDDRHLAITTNELLIFIILFLSSARDKVKLRYVSSWLRYVIEATLSLCREFVWLYHDSHEEIKVA